MTDQAPSLAARITRAQAALRAHPGLLTDAPHPNADYARQGRSLRAAMAWMLQHAGNAGKTRACKTIEAAVRSIAEPTFSTKP